MSKVNNNVAKFTYKLKNRIFEKILEYFGNFYHEFNL